MTATQKLASEERHARLWAYFITQTTVKCQDTASACLHSKHARIHLKKARAYRSEVPASGSCSHPSEVPQRHQLLPLLALLHTVTVRVLNPEKNKRTTSTVTTTAHQLPSCLSTGPVIKPTHPHDLLSFSSASLLLLCAS